MRSVVSSLGLLALSASSALGLIVHDAATVLDFGALRLHLCAPDIIRVTYSTDDDVPARVASAVVRTWEDSVDYDITENTPSPGLTTVQTSACMIVVNTTSPIGDVSFYSADGSELLLQERPGGRTLDASTATPTTRQEWILSNDAEALYGGGSMQQGFLNFRDSPLQLAQRNTEASIPYFLSSAGWGLLWDSTANTWLNRPSEDTWVTSAPCSDSGFSFSFTPSVSGRHIVTATYGDYVFVAPEAGNGGTGGAALVFESADTGSPSGSIRGTVFNFTMTTNMPATVSGRTSLPLEAGTRYTFTWTTSPGSCDGDPKADVHVSPPGDGFSLTALDDTFIDYYFMAARSLDEAVSLYRKTSGAAPLYPKWVYGFWQCKVRPSI